MDITFFANAFTSFADLYFAGIHIQDSIIGVARGYKLAKAAQTNPFVG